MIQLLLMHLQTPFLDYKYNYYIKFLSIVFASNVLHSIFLSNIACQMKATIKAYHMLLGHIQFPHRNRIREVLK